ncbi:MAG TPA: SLBB domain-containing protein, partial [Chroococcales cyanobacterium]
MAAEKERIIQKVKAAGVVGAGGAGFPTHVKFAAEAKVVIANGAECEPLLRSDQQIMALYPEELVRGLKAAMVATGAKEGVLALKGKYREAVSALSKIIAEEKNIRILKLESVYPAGDEAVLTYEVTGRVMPEGGLPLDVGAVVCNVNTLINVARALDDQPVTHRYVTVTGAVNRPSVFLAPLGISFIRLIEQAGGTKFPDYAVISGGPMTGEVVCPLETRVTKTSGGIIVLPEDHYLIRRKKMPLSTQLRRSKAACCQCTQCTSV